MNQPCCPQGNEERCCQIAARHWAIAAALVVLFAVAAPWVFAVDDDKDVKSENAVVHTEDRLNLHLTYWEAPKPSPDTPVLILLHGQDSNRLDWPKSLIAKLHSEGYAIVAPDLRGHGQSKGVAALPAGEPGVEGTGKKTRKEKEHKIDAAHLKPRDYTAMVNHDMEAVKTFIYQQHQQKKLNMNKCAIVAADLSAIVAAYFTEKDWGKQPLEDAQEGMGTPTGKDIRALVLLSPPFKAPGLPVTKNTVRSLKEPTAGIAIFVAVGSGDKADKGDAWKLYGQLATPDKNRERMEFHEYDSAGRGIRLLDPAKMSKRKAQDSSKMPDQQILTFLDKFLKQLSSKWIDRKGKIDG